MSYFYVMYLNYFLSAVIEEVHIREEITVRTNQNVQVDLLEEMDYKLGLTVQFHYYNYKYII